MSLTLKRIRTADLAITTGTTLTTGSETGPASGKVWNIPRLYISNPTASAVTLTLNHVNGGVSIAIVPGKSIAANDGIVLENIVLVNGDTLVGIAGTGSALDAYGCIIEEDA